jgi:hypothetical protein
MHNGKGVVCEQQVENVRGSLPRQPKNDTLFLTAKKVPRLGRISRNGNTSVMVGSPITNSRGATLEPPPLPETVQPPGVRVHQSHAPTRIMTRSFI